MCIEYFQICELGILLAVSKIDSQIGVFSVCVGV